MLACLFVCVSDRSHVCFTCCLCAACVRGFVLSTYMWPVLSLVHVVKRGLISNNVIHTVTSHYIQHARSLPPPHPTHTLYRSCSLSSFFYRTHFFPPPLTPFISPHLSLRYLHLLKNHNVPLLVFTLSLFPLTPLHSARLLAASQHTEHLLIHAGSPLSFSVYPKAWTRAHSLHPLTCLSPFYGRNLTLSLSLAHPFHAI